MKLLTVVVGTTGTCDAVEVPVVELERKVSGHSERLKNNDHKTLPGICHGN